MDKRSNVLKKITLIAIIIFTFSVGSLFSDGIEFNIRYYDKKIYFPNSSIFVKAEITNNSAESYRFKLADARVFNLDFEVKTLQNRKIKHSEDYKIQKNPDNPVFFREITLAPGEQFSFVENLSRYVENFETGVYVVNALFYPELNRGINPEVFTSNSLNLSVRPPAGVPELAARIDEDTGEILRRNPIPPDAVVDFLLTARQKSQWEKFLLYIDVEQLMLKSIEREKVYLRLSEEDRRAMVEEYRNELKMEVADETIVLIPDEYTIKKTEYTPEKGKVLAELKFQYPGYKEIKEYTYYLHRKDRIWYVYNYDVRNMGTE